MNMLSWSNRNVECMKLVKMKSVDTYYGIWVEIVLPITYTYAVHALYH